MEYLGHYILGEVVATDPKKVKVVTNWHVPRTIKQLKGFLGLTRYYRRFVQNYWKIAHLLIVLCKNTGILKWTKEANIAFNELKVAMITAPVLALPDFSKEFFYRN